MSDQSWGRLSNGKPTIHIHDLPIDVLRLIFEECLPESPRFPTVSVASVPLLFTAVCSSWRNLAMCTPRLWTRCPVTFSTHCASVVDPTMLAKRGQGYARWLECAGNAEVSIAFDLDPVQLDYRESYHDAVMAMLDHIWTTRFTRRWRSLRLHILCKWFSSRWTDRFLQLHLPSLRHLSILEDSLSEPSKGRLFASPLLQSIHLDTTFRPKATARLKDLPISRWAAITRLILDQADTLQDDLGFSWVEVLETIKRCAATLEELSVSFEPQVVGNSSQKELLFFPSLKILRVVEHNGIRRSPPYLDRFMSSLHAPAVQTLEFQSSCTPPGHDGPLLRFLQSNAPSSLSNLTNVTLQYNYLSPGDFASFLDIVGGDGAVVETLKFHYYHPPASWNYHTPIHAKFSSAMLRKCGTLFPRLRAFSCKLANRHEFSDHDLLDFIKHRMRHPEGSQEMPDRAMLERVEVQFAPRSEKAIGSLVDALKTWLLADELQPRVAHLPEIRVTYRERGV